MKNKEQKFNVGDFIHFIALPDDVFESDDYDFEGLKSEGFDEDWGIIISSHRNPAHNDSPPRFEIHWVKDGLGSCRYTLAFLNKYCNVIARSE